MSKDSLKREIAKPSSLINYVLLVAIIAIALYIRLPDSPPPYLWLDEAWRAVAIELNPSLGQLISYMSQAKTEVIQPSEWVLGRIGLFLFGKQEFAFRFFPLLFSGLYMAASYILIRHISRSYVAILAPFLLGCSYLFIFHARHFKPFSLDLFLTLAVFLAAIFFTENPSRKRELILISVLAIFALSAIPSLFIMPGVACYLLYQRFYQKSIDLIRIVRIASIPFSLYVLNYLFLLKTQAPGDLQKLWDLYYLDSFSKIPFLFEDFTQYLDASAPIDWRILIISYLLVMPLISLYRKDGFWILSIAPLVVQIVLSFLNIYPLFGRASFYLYGIIVVSFVYSVAEIVRIIEGKFSQHKNILQLASALVILSYLSITGGVAQDIESARNWPTAQGRESFQILASNFAEGDRLQFGGGSYFTLKFYQDIDLAENEYLAALDFDRKDTLYEKKGAVLCRQLKDLGEPIAPGMKVWFVSTHRLNAYQLYQDLLPQIGDVEVHVARPKEGLIAVTLEEPFANLDCLAYEASLSERLEAPQ